MANNDTYQSFKCPSCRQYISNQVDSCRFCFVPLSDEIKEQSIEQELDESRRYRFKSNKTIFYTGIGIFALGAFFLLGSLASIFLTGEGRFFIWSPIVALFGLGQIIIGSLGMLEERKRKK